MKIEPEALYSLYETLFLPVEKEKKSDKKSEELKPDIRMLMLFDQKPSDDEANFLNKILAAISIKPEETESNYNVTLETLSEVITAFSGNILIWGIDHADVEKYNLVKHGESSVIVSDSLNAVMNNQALKAKLWNCLKDAFVKS